MWQVEAMKRSKIVVRIGVFYYSYNLLNDDAGLLILIQHHRLISLCLELITVSSPNNTPSIIAMA